MAKKKHFVTNGDESIHLHSANGTAYELAVGNDGALTVTNEATGAVSGGGGGLPTGGAPHQQLVTDAEGKALWEGRLAYAYTGMVEILPETTFEATEETEGMALIMEPPLHMLIEGGTYEVNYNGASYNCVCYALASEEDGTIYVLGNAGAVEEGLPVTDDPFVIAFYEEAFAVAQGLWGMAIPLDGSTTITLSITGEAEKVSHMDRKYIKDMYGEDIKTTLYLDERNPVEIAASEYDTPAFGIQTPLEKELEPNVEYVVVVNGKRYKATATEGIINGAHGFFLGISDKFSMVFFGEGAESDYHGSISVIAPLLYPVKTVAVYREIVTVHKVPEKYIPERIVYVKSAEFESRVAAAFADASLTKQLTYAQAKVIMAGPFAVGTEADGLRVNVFPLSVEFLDAEMKIQASFFGIDNGNFALPTVMFFFADTPT